MANEQKLLPPSMAVLWVPQDPGIDDVNAPTPEELVFDLENPTTGPAYNISCAIVQSDFTAQFTDRDTNTDKSLCDDSNVEIPIYKNYEVTLTFFLDADETTVESAYNVAYELFKTPLSYGYIVTRVRYHYSAPFEDGQDVQVFYVQATDPQIVHNEGEPVKMTVNFLPQGSSSNGLVPVGGGS